MIIIWENFQKIYVKNFGSSESPLKEMDFKGFAWIQKSELN